MLFGVLAGLGLYAGAGGPVGDFLEAVARGLLGVAGYVVPPLIAWFGLLVVLGRPSPEIGRIAVGSVLLGLGLLSAWHLIAGSPAPADGISRAVARGRAGRLGRRDAAGRRPVGLGRRRGLRRAARSSGP